MSNKSEHVRRWRQRTKERMVAAMGGKCAICGYDRCLDALEFHHIDPSQKDLKFSRARANPSSWSFLVEELRKCVLLCSCCHKEIHSGQTELPKYIPTFDERYVEYKSFEKSLRTELLFNDCPVCGKSKKASLYVCSNACAAKKKINWDQIDLIKMLETNSMSEAGRIIGCATNTIGRRLAKINRS